MYNIRQQERPSFFFFFQLYREKTAVWKESCFNCFTVKCWERACCGYGVGLERETAWMGNGRDIWGEGALFVRPPHLRSSTPDPKAEFVRKMLN